MSHHVLVIPSWYPSDQNDPAGCFFREQAIALAQFGHTVGVIAPFGLSLRRPKKWIEANGTKVAAESGVVTLRRSFVSLFGRLPYLGAMQWVSAGLKMYRDYVHKNGTPDIIHAHSIWNGGLLANAIFSRYQVPFVLTEHSTAFSRGRVKSWQARWGRRVVANAGALIAVSDPFRSLLDTFFGSSSAWKTIPNIVDARFLDEPLSRHLERGRFIFLSIAYMEEKKNQEALVRAFAEAFSNDLGVELVLAGDGPLRAMLESLVSELGLKNQVHFTGILNRAEVVETIKRSDAFVLPSKVETFGVVVVEALALGVPVVVTVCGGPESFVSPSDGLVVPSSDIGPLAHAMREMVLTRHMYISEEIRARCAELYSGSAVVRQLNDVYAEVLCRNH